VDTLNWYRALAVAVLLLFCSLPGAWAAPAPADYATTYTITLHEDGSALWKVEYRTPLVTDGDMADFRNYSHDLNTVYLPQLEDLMQRSAAQAASGTGRQMAVDNFSGTAVVQTSPTGTFGVVTYSFTWTDFGVSDGSLSAGDAFAGGMYLAKESTLIITYPHDYSVAVAEPAPDQQSGDGLTWYGLRSFGTGEPQVVLERPAFPFLPALLGLVVIIIAAAGIVTYRKRRLRSIPEDLPADLPEDLSDPVPRLSEADLLSLEERIVKLLRANGGEQFQSEIVRVLGMPKSTVSSTLNDLHRRGMIQKIRKGRENLIRLVDESR
jgi:DNA-binding transcriptional ArsR family regulator